ncbi:MAG: hypothetical protein ACREXR_05975 [Gammaproteobacteria bacterium]
MIETYLLTGMRYLEMNPVRAALVDHPAHYRWTRYRADPRAVITAAHPSSGLSLGAVALATFGLTL